MGRSVVSRAGLAWFALSVLALAPGTEAKAGGFTNLDFGIRRQGMFAVVARPDDGTSLFHNPAGMTLEEGTVFSHHQSWLIGDAHLRFYDSQGTLRPDHEIEPDWNLGMIPYLGLISDFGTDRWRAGLAVYAPNAYGASLPESEPTRYHATQVLFLGTRATAGVAYEFSDMLSLGASASLVNVFLTAERYMNPAVLNDPDQRFLPQDETEAQDSLLELSGMDFTWAWDVGLLFRPMDRLRVGFSFSSGSGVDLEGDVKLTDHSGNVQKSKHKTQMTIPFTLNAGLNFELTPDFQIGADVHYWHYQVLQEQWSVLSTPIMGMTEFRDPKNNGNSWNWCVGVLYKVHPKLELMMGFQQDTTPTPDTTYTLDNLSRDQFGLSAGARWQLTDNLRLGIAFVRNWMDLVDVQESISTPPTNVKGYAHGSEVGFGLDWTL